MKYKFEIKKENRSIIWKILFLLIYFSFYAISIRLFMTYFPFINKGLIIIVGILIYLIIILPMVFTPRWYLNNDSILIIQPSGLIETWEYFILKKGIQEIKYSVIENISITYEKISTQYIYNEGYNILFKVCLKSGDEIIFDSLLGIDKSDYLRGIEMIKKEGITFIDKYHILSVLENDNINLWEQMIKILWLLESKINSDFINKISNELELKMQISSSFENGLIYDVIILENLSIISHLSEIQKNSILIYVLDEKNNIFDHQNIYVNYYIRNLSLYEDLYQAFLKSKDFLLKKINTISLKSGKINYHIIKNNILYIESFRNYIVIHTSISDYTLRYTLKKIQKKLGNEFIQCHKSYLVNLNNVICIKENTIELKNEVTLPIGNKYKQNLYNLICK